MTGYLIHDGEAQTAHANARAQPEAYLTVPVASFTCGDRRMDRDLYRALNASEFPQISYELLDVEALIGQLDARETHEILTRGNLTVGGVTRCIETRLSGTRLPDGRLRASGVQELMMSDFELSGRQRSGASLKPGTSSRSGSISMPDRQRCRKPAWPIAENTARSRKAGAYAHEPFG